MTPLGQQIARLLAPERWDEWSEGLYVIVHRPTGVEIWMGTGAIFFETWPPAGLFGFWDGLKLYRMARRVLRHIQRREAIKRGDELARKLMTEEERAIEELLR